MAIASNFERNPALLVVAISLAAASAFGQAKNSERSETPDRRLCEAGPLAKDDFRADPPGESIASARTVTELRHEFSYTYRESGRSVIAKLDKIKIQSYVRRDKSWNKQPDNAALMDHEQGHADNALIESLKARADFAKRSSTFTTTARTKDEAAAALERQVRAKMKTYEAAMLEQDSLYDQQTRNGLDATKQHEWRRVQMETIKKLATSK